MPLPTLLRTRATVTQPVGVSVGGGGLYGGSSGGTVYSRIGQPAATAPQVQVAGYGGTTSGVSATRNAPTIPSGGANPRLIQTPGGVLPAQGELATMARNNIFASMVAGSILMSVKYFSDNPVPSTPSSGPGPTPQNFYPSGQYYGGTASTIGQQMTPPRIPGESAGTRAGSPNSAGPGTSGAGVGTGLGSSPNSAGPGTSGAGVGTGLVSFPTTPGQDLGSKMPSYTDPNMRAGGGVSTSPGYDPYNPPKPLVDSQWYLVRKGQILPNTIMPAGYTIRKLNKPDCGSGYGFGRFDPNDVQFEDFGCDNLQTDYFFPVPLGDPPVPPALATPNTTSSAGPQPPPTAAASVPQSPPQAPGMPMPGQTPTSTGSAGKFSPFPGLPLPQAPNPTPRPAALPQITPTPGPGPGPNTAAPDGSSVPNVQAGAGTTPALGTPPSIGSAPTPAQAATAAPTPTGVIPIPGLEPPLIPQPTNPPPPPPNRCNDPCVQGVADGVGSILDLIGALLSNFFGGIPPSDPPPPGSALADVLGQIQDDIADLTAGGGVGGGTGGGQDLTALLQALAAKLDQVGETVGIGEFPATVPTTLISKEGKADTTKQLANLAQFLAWTVEQIDALFGQWEIPLEIADTDLTKAGNQSAKLKLPNLAEATAEQVGLLLNLTASINALTEISMRTLLESGLAHKEAATAHIYGRENAQFLAYQGKEITVKIPMTFTPGGKNLEEMLKSGEVEIKAWENVDKHDIKYYFNDLKQAAAIIRAVFWKKVNPNGDVARQIIDFVKEADFLTTDEERQNDDFDNFLDRVEEGFTSARGIVDPIRPYGRDVIRRPRIRQLGDTGPTGNTTGGALGGT